MDGFLDIRQAAAALRVTDKTVRNYLRRGFLVAERWNGKIRIPKSQIDAVYYKKYGKAPGDKEREDASGVGVLPAGKTGPAGVQAGVSELAAENHDLRERLTRLEAAAASAWTESRKYREDLQAVRHELDETRQREESARVDAQVLRRRLDALRGQALADRSELDEMRKALGGHLRDSVDLMQRMEEQERAIRERERLMKGWAD